MPSESVSGHSANVASHLFPFCLHALLQASADKHMHSSFIPSPGGAAILKLVVEPRVKKTLE